jgi:hypothetical protein
MIEGSCLCGAVTIRLAAHDPAVTACHCRMCLRWTGGPFAGFDAPVEAVSISGKVAIYASSAFAERAFCPRCGSHLWFRDTVPAGRPAAWALSCRSTASRRARWWKTASTR